jgi:transposase
VLRDAKLSITQLEKRIGCLTAEAVAWIENHPGLERTMALLVRVKGIAQTSAIALMGELLLLPPNLSHREWVKFAGLDPKACDSGKSVHKKTRMSKAGNRHIRSALYMPALSAKQHDPHQGLFRPSYGKWQEAVAGCLRSDAQVAPCHSRNAQIR